jgi:hypothetical protein
METYLLKAGDKVPLVRDGKPIGNAVVTGWQPIEQLTRGTVVIDTRNDMLAMVDSYWDGTYHIEWFDGGGLACSWPGELFPVLRMPDA